VDGGSVQIAILNSLDEGGVGAVAVGAVGEGVDLLNRSSDCHAEDRTRSAASAVCGGAVQVPIRCWKEGTARKAG
jgi:hypothetical protein